jgi:nickel/cobalt transporter (NiCoT) family protein
MRRLSGFAGAVLALHLLGWGLFWWYSRHYTALAGLGTLAYAFGLRHAFDADHIAAIDNTTRKLLRDGERPLGVGFFFSLGHSTVVFALVAALALNAQGSPVSSWQHYGAYLGPSLAGTFLWTVGILNLVVLVDLVRAVGELRRGRLDHGRLERRLLDRGFVSRLFVGRLACRIHSSWQMYAVGALFGLGFDTATEVVLLALACRTATHAIPFAGVVSLPLLFAAGMSLVDTATGGFMREAYTWAFRNPVRTLVYNVTVTSVSVAVALAVGTILLLQVAARALALSGGFWAVVTTLDLVRLGVGIVAVSILTLAGATIVCKSMRQR